MATLIRPKRWGLQKPPPGTQINWGHPLASGLQVAVNITDGGPPPRDLVTGTSLTLSGTPTSVMTPYGPAWQFTHSPNLNFTTKTIPSSVVSLDARVFVNLTTNGVYVKWGDSSHGYGMGIGDTTFDGNGNNFIGLMENVSWLAPGIALTTGWHHLALTLDGAGINTFYIDGVAKGTVTHTGLLSAASQPFYIGGYPVNTRVSTSTIAHARAWGRVLTPSDIQWLYAEPYAFMQSQSPQRRYWVIGSGGLANVWNGSAWVQKPAMVWNGSAWVQKPVEVWTGSAWKVST